LWKPFALGDLERYVLKDAWMKFFIILIFVFLIAFMTAVTGGYADGCYCEYTQEYVKLLRETDYSRGVNDGYLKGHKEGFEKGTQIGKKLGADAEYSKGRSSGFSEGVESGKIEGEKIGRASGYQEGFKEGVKTGQIEGEKNGRTNGYEEGFKDGETKCELHYKSTPFDDLIRSNPVAWFLGTLFAGFLSGVGAHKYLIKLSRT
jgi:flagellar biosynthesis/type III secretory pathway protein FliH